MTIYLAVTSLHYTGYEMLKGADILSSYFYCRSIPEITSTIPYMRDFMLDSGVFSFINSGKKFDDKYVHQYADYIKENKIKSYVELDVDQLIGVKETRKLRDKLEKLVGWPSIPVWHTIRGKDFLTRCEGISAYLLRLLLDRGPAYGSDREVHAVVHRQGTRE